jgi:hypothetical protein
MASWTPIGSDRLKHASKNRTGAPTTRWRNDGARPNERTTMSNTETMLSELRQIATEVKNPDINRGQVGAFIDEPALLHLIRGAVYSTMPPVTGALETLPNIPGDMVAVVSNKPAEYLIEKLRKNVDGALLNYDRVKFINPELLEGGRLTLDQMPVGTVCICPDPFSHLAHEIEDLFTVARQRDSVILIDDHGILDECIHERFTFDPDSTTPEGIETGMLCREKVNVSTVTA